MDGVNVIFWVAVAVCVRIWVDTTVLYEIKVVGEITVEIEKIVVGVAAHFELAENY